MNTLRLLSLFLVLAAISLRQGEKARYKTRPLANGVYAVLAEDVKVEAVRTDKLPRAVMVYDRKYSDADQHQAPRFVALDLSAFVPLILAGNPDVHTDERGHAALTLRLAPEHAKTLEDFTRARLGGRIAIVIGGEIATMHKVRSVIQDGKAQITRCTDNACERLYVELTR